MTEMRMDNFEDHFENNPRRKGHSKLVAKDGKIATERDSEAKQFSQAEVDALIATERALVVQRAADEVNQCLQIIITNAGNWYDVATERENAYGKITAAVARASRAYTLADPNALQEHDAALRQQWDNESFPNKWIEAKVKVRDEYISKLEAENAGLRTANTMQAEQFREQRDALRKQIATAERRTTDALASLKWAVYALEHGTSVEVHWLKHVAREPYQKVLAVIAELEAAGPEDKS